MSSSAAGVSVSPASAMDQETRLGRGRRGGPPHRNGGGRFRAEIEMDRGIASLPRSPELGFAAAVREPLVRLQRPKYDFERWDWEYFAWPHDRLDANLDMRDSDPRATFEEDRKASEGFLIRTAMQLEACQVLPLPSRSTPRLEAPGMPKQEEIDGSEMLGHGALWLRRGCAELSPLLPMTLQGPCAY